MGFFVMTSLALAVQSIEYGVRSTRIVTVYGALPGWRRKVHTTTATWTILRMPEDAVQYYSVHYYREYSVLRDAHQYRRRSPLLSTSPRMNSCGLMTAQYGEYGEVPQHFIRAPECARSGRHGMTETLSRFLGCSPGDSPIPTPYRCGAVNLLPKNIYVVKGWSRQHRCMLPAYLLLAS